MKTVILKAVMAIAIFGSSAVSANDVNFSVGTGFPYLVTVEGAYTVNDNSNLFLNYKIGLDDGFAFGYQHALENTNHVIGTYVGAVGIKDSKCDDSTEATDYIELIASSFGCALQSAFGDETTQGIAAFYGYSFSGLNNPGWHLRFEAGYGNNKNRENNTGHFNFSARYQF